MKPIYSVGKLMLAVCFAALYSCGNQGAVATNQESAKPKSVPPEAQDPDPTIRVVALDAPCFIFKKTKTFQGMLDSIALVHKLTADKDDEALATLQSQGFFVTLVVGVHVKVDLSDSIYPYVRSTVASKRYIGTVCMIDRSNLVTRSDLPLPDPPVSVTEQQEQIDTSSKIIDAAIAGINTTEASKIYDDKIWGPFLERHHLRKGWDQVKK